MSKKVPSSSPDFIQQVDRATEAAFPASNQRPATPAQINENSLSDEDFLTPEFLAETDRLTEVQSASTVAELEEIFNRGKYVYYGMAINMCIVE